MYRLGWLVLSIAFMAVPSASRADSVSEAIVGLMESVAVGPSQSRSRRLSLSPGRCGFTIDVDLPSQEIHHPSASQRWDADPNEAYKAIVGGRIAVDFRYTDDSRIARISPSIYRGEDFLAVTFDYRTRRDPMFVLQVGRVKVTKDGVLNTAATGSELLAVPKLPEVASSTSQNDFIYDFGRYLSERYAAPESVSLLEYAKGIGAASSYRELADWFLANSIQPHADFLNVYSNAATLNPFSPDSGLVLVFGPRTRVVPHLKVLLENCKPS